MIRKYVGALLVIIILAETIYLAGAYIQRWQMESFSCAANLVQHYNGKAYYLSLNYTIRRDFGVVHIRGRSDLNHEKMFNCKIPSICSADDDVY